MARLSLTRRLHFNAAHRLHSPHLSDHENDKLFGPCNNPNYHGHNYELEVSVCGEPDPVTGYIADLTEIKRVVTFEVLDKLDHKNLNLDVPEFEHLNSTVENIALVIWEMLDGKLPAALSKVVLWETPRNSATIERE